MKLKKLLKIVMVLLICTLAVFPGKVNSAQNLTLSGSQKITVTRNVLGVTNPVSNTFTYSIVPDSNNPAAVTGAPTSFQIAFDGTEAITSNQLTKTAQINFDGTTFTAPGNYAFKVTETASTDNTTYPVDSKTYYVYVLVRYDTSTDDGSMTAQVLTQGKVNNTGNKQDVVFPVDSVFTNLSVSKTVTGDLGDKTEYFPIKVNVGGNTGDTYKISGGTYASNPTTATANTVVTVYLKHGETITIGKDGTLNQIPVGTQYVVTEDPVTNYTTKIDNASVQTTTKVTVATPSSNVTNVVNDYSSASFTGILFDIAPFALLIALAIIPIKVFTRKK